MVLTTDSAVVEKPAEEEHEHAGGHHTHGHSHGGHGHSPLSERPRRVTLIIGGSAARHAVAARPLADDRRRPAWTRREGGSGESGPALFGVCGGCYTPAATAAGSAAISRARSSSLMPPQTP